MQNVRRENHDNIRRNICSIKNILLGCCICLFHRRNSLSIGLLGGGIDRIRTRKRTSSFNQMGGITMLQLNDEQEDWLRHIVNDAHKALWIEKFRKLLNHKKRIDLGTIFVANYGQLE